jgi:hypothetical protein
LSADASRKAGEPMRAVLAAPALIEKSGFSFADGSKNEFRRHIVTA